jgi:hypothetical protein
MKQPPLRTKVERVLKRIERMRKLCGGTAFYYEIQDEPDKARHCEHAGKAYASCATMLRRALK